MRKIFDSYIMVDWSAASKPTTGSDSIWIGALTPDARMKLKFSSSNPETREKAVQQLKAAIERLTKRGDRVLVGFDFSLGFPRGTSAALNIGSEEQSPWEALTTFLSREMKDRPDNSNNRFPLAARMNRLISDGPFPFWGCAKKDELTTLTVKKARDHQKDDLPEFRLTETRCIEQKRGRPQPVWKLSYAGAVGGQTLTGIPRVLELRNQFTDNSAIWPQETGWIDSADQFPQVLFSEVYPSLVQAKPRAGQTKDESQVESLCFEFSKLDESGTLFELFRQPEAINDVESEVICREEGWILGI